MPIIKCEIIYFPPNISLLMTKLIDSFQILEIRAFGRRNRLYYFSRNLILYKIESVESIYFFIFDSRIYIFLLISMRNMNLSQ